MGNFSVLIAAGGSYSEAVFRGVPKSTEPMAAALAHRTRTSKSSVLSLPAFAVAAINLRRLAVNVVLDDVLLCVDGPASGTDLCVVL